MNPNIVNFYKRNPKATCAFLVLDEVYDNLAAAERVKKYYGAKKVTIVLKKEYDDWVKTQKKQPEENSQANITEETK